MTTRRWQAGISLVELIIGMAVTAIVLGGMVAIVFTLTNAYNSWVGRIADASNGDVLAAAIQADSHRLIACSTTIAELDFCLVDGSPAVAYHTQGPAPYAVIRRAGSKSQVVVRGLAATPIYHVDCDASAGTGSGYIEVDRMTGLGALRVYYRSPLGTCRET